MRPFSSVNKLRRVIKTLLENRGVAGSVMAWIIIKYIKCLWFQSHSYYMVIVNSYFKAKQIYDKRDMIPTCKTISRDTFEIRKMHRSWHGLIFGTIMCIWNKWPLSTNSCVISTAIDHKWCLVTFQIYANISLAKNIVCYGAYLDVRALK